MEPPITESARRHGISDHDIVHAFNNPIPAEDLDEGLTMLIGADPAGVLIDVGVADSDEVQSSSTP